MSTQALALSCLGGAPGPCASQVNGTYGVR